jgi:general secretion pathway protein A
MYENYFGLSERPFSISPDPRFFYLSPQHREAVAKCEYSLSQKMGLAAVFGDIGMGKTTIARRLLQKLLDEPRYNVASLVHPNLPSPYQFMRQIRREFGDDRPRRSLIGELNDFQRYLIENHEQGKTTVLFVDEAQNLRRPLFEVLRQLLNFETNTQKLLQIILFGQNELAVKIDRMPELKDRVTMFAALSSLRREETDALIDFRWRVAGGEQHPFADDALDAILRFSGGQPRQLCKICDAALIRAFSHQMATIDAAVIEQVAADIRIDSPAAEQRNVAEALPERQAA